MTTKTLLSSRPWAGRFGLGALALLLVTSLGCETDSPTAPTPQPTPNVPPPSSSTWSIELIVAPNPVQLKEDGSAVTVEISVFVRRANDGTPPPNNATVVLSTSSGLLSTLDGASGTTLPVLLTAGRGRAVLTVSGVDAKTVVLQGRLESSFNQIGISLLSADDGGTEDPLFVESVIPNTGPPTGGTRVTIRGTGFVTPIRVFFGSNAALVRSSDAASIVVETPPIDLAVGAIQTVPVRVDVGVNTVDAGSDTLSNAFTYTRGDTGPPVPPRILSVSPSSGPNEGGTRVTILGEGFAEEVQVFFGTQALIEASVQDVSPTRLVVLSPAAIGTNAVNRDRLVDIRVVNRDSGAEAVRSGAFQYGSPTEPVTITSVAPTQAPYTGGTLVEIFGQGFAEPVAVSFADFAMAPQSVTGTKIVVRTVAIDVDSCDDVTGEVDVVNIETGVGASGPDFTFIISEPVMSSITPTTVPAAGGVPFTISGSGFDASTRVTLVFPGGNVTVAGITVNVTGTTITGTLPPFLGAFEEEDCDDNGDGQSGTRLLPTAVSIKIENRATTCEDTFENVLVYTPASAVCVGDVAPPPPPPPPPPAPVAAFHFVVNGCSVSFVSDATDATSHSWSFGDGGSSSVANPTHAYVYAVGPRDFTVTYTVTNSAGSDSDVQLVSILAAACP